jgi:hypothetical protein
MTTRQNARLVSGWIASIGLDSKLFGTHSLRRTKTTLIYRRTGNLRAVQLSATRRSKAPCDILASRWMMPSGRVDPVFESSAAQIRQNVIYVTARPRKHRVPVTDYGGVSHLKRSYRQ